MGLWLIAGVKRIGQRYCDLGLRAPTCYGSRDRLAPSYAMSTIYAPELSSLRTSPG